MNCYICRQEPQNCCCPKIHNSPVLKMEKEAIGFNLYTNSWEYWENIIKKNASEMQILIGPIASGKSTYSRNKAKDGWLVVNDDAIVMAVHGNEYSCYDNTLKPLYEQISMNIITSAAMLRKSVIIDRPNFKNDTRNRYLQIGKSLGMLVTAVVFKDHGRDEHVRRRMEHDNRGNTKEMWEKIYDSHKNLADPVDRKLFDKVTYVY